MRRLSPSFFFSYLLAGSFLWLSFFSTTSASPLFSNQVPKPINLLFDDQTITINFRAQPELLTYEPIHYLAWGKELIPVDLKGALPEKSEYMDFQTRFEPKISVPHFYEFLESAFATSQVKEDTLRITRNEHKWITFHSTPKNGYEIDKDLLVNLINQAITNKEKNVRVPGKKIFSNVEIDPTLKERGIKEVLSIGQSNFAGSAETRIQNIRAAAKKFNGYIIRKGQSFSFNRVLGSVSKDDGFVEELVIKGNELKKELGGGVCQVSTTMFRAAYQAGLKITARKNHSFAVPYYKPAGIDAAIYLNAHDLRFVNNTNGDILIHAFIERNNLFIAFYGTREDRKVVLEGPFISSIIPAPLPMVYETEELPKGKIQYLSKGHSGFQSKWVRKIRINNRWYTDILTSNYRPWPAQIRRGIGEKTELLAQKE